MADKTASRMNWRLKAGIQNTIAAFPIGSSALYYGLQRALGGLRKGMNTPVERFRSAIRIADWIHAAGSTVENKRFLEVGTGHMVNVPTALWLIGAAETTTVDLYRYLSFTLIRESIQFIRDNESEVVALFGSRAGSATFQSRLKQLLRFNGELNDLLAMMNVKYLSPADASDLSASDRSFDFHISNTVLEHIPRAIILAILREAKRVLALDGMMVHIIDPSDHFSHSDSSIT
ncbi:MAG TPA: class I SAM-dependent methyltransferase, partial [Gemmatimonadaceae bacterium]|nr:class I SAM-dependent methyltransferase [Gemmatimonadaceae bacterium]